MVQIAIKICEGGCDEWVMMELQGDLETRNNISLNQQFLADLHFTKKGEPVMIVGHHILYGKVSHIDKPFAVLVKDDQTAGGSSMDTDDRESEVTYRVQALIKKKIHFKTRPKPIIANVPKTV